MARTRSIIIAAVIVIVAVVGFVYVRSGSSTSSADAVGTSGSEGPVSVTTSAMFVTLENRESMPLKDLKVGIVPVSRATVFYTPIISRIESQGKRVISLGEFRGTDGTPLNMRIHRPQTITITGQRLDGKPVQMEVAWK